MGPGNNDGSIMTYRINGVSQETGGGEPDDRRVKVTEFDTTPEFLGAKVSAGDNIDINVVDGFGNALLEISANPPPVVGLEFSDANPFYLNDKLVAGPGTAFETVDNGGIDAIQITAFEPPADTIEADGLMYTDIGTAITAIMALGGLSGRLLRFGPSVSSWGALSFDQDTYANPISFRGAATRTKLVAAATPVLTVGGGELRVFNFEILATADDSGETAQATLSTQIFPNTGVLNLYTCILKAITVTDGAHTIGAGAINYGLTRLFNCNVECSATTGTIYGLYASNFGVIEARQGRIVGDVYADTDGTIRLYGPTVTGTVGGPGTLEGYYINASTGELVLLSGITPLKSYVNEYTVDTTGAGDYTDLATAITDLAGSGAIIRVGPGTFNVNYLHAHNLRITGSGIGQTIIRDSTPGGGILRLEDTGAGDLWLSDLTLRLTQASSQQMTAAGNYSDDYIIHARRVKIEVTATGYSDAAGDAYYGFTGAYASHKTQLDLVDCYVDFSNVYDAGSPTDTPLAIPFFGWSIGTHYIRGCFLKGDAQHKTAMLVTGASIKVSIDDTTIGYYPDGGTITIGTAGTVRGTVRDENGYIYFLGVVGGDVEFGGIVTASQITSNIPDGPTPPLVVTSTARIPNLNADMLDGYHASDFENRVLYNVSKTVKTSGGDFSTIQAAVNWFKNKVCFNCSILVDPGTWLEDVTLVDIVTPYPSGIIIIGDTRSHVGMTYCHGYPGNRQGYGGLGAQNGTVTFSTAGNNITIAVAGGNPNFATYGMAAGDNLTCRQTSGNYVNRTVSSVSGNVITCTTAAPTIAGNGGAVFFSPNRIISGYSGNGINAYCNARLKGFQILGAGIWAFSALSVTGAAYVEAHNCGFQSGSFGVQLNASSVFSTGNTPVSFINNTYGLVTNSADGYVSYSTVLPATSGGQAGFLSQWAGRLTANYCNVMGYPNGYLSQLQAFTDAQLSAVGLCTYAFNAGHNGYIYAPSTNALAAGKGNTTVYTPATSGTSGNYEGLIYWT